MAELSPAAERLLYRKVSRRLVPLLFLSYIAAYLDRVNVGFAKLGMAGDLGFSDSVYGLGAGIFFIGYFVFEVPSNLILERVGARLWIARIMIGWGVVSAATMLVRTPFSFYSMRFLLGLAEAGFFPGVILYLTYWFPRTYRVRMVALFMTAVAVAGIVGGPVSGWILGHLAGVGRLHAWQWLFLLEGLPSVAIGIAVLAFLTDGPRSASWLLPVERAFLLRRVAEEEALKQAEFRRGEGGAGAMQAFREGRVWGLSLVYFGFAMGVYGVSFWLPQIIKETVTADPFAIGLVSAIPWLVGGIVMVLNGRHSDRTGERRWHVTLAALVGGLALGASGIPGIGGWAGIAALTIATAGILSGMSCFWALPTALLRGTAAAVGIAWINSIGNLGGYASPALVGKLRDRTGSMTVAMGLLAACLIGSAALTVVLAPRSAVSSSPEELGGAIERAGQPIEPGRE
jgi:MFS family permease